MSDNNDNNNNTSGLTADQWLGEAIAQTYQPLSWAESVALRAREAQARIDELTAQVVALTQALETAQARIDELVSERERDAAPAEPSTAEEYETLTGAPSTYEALLNGADAIDARRKGGA